ncbi:MAG: glutamine--tRNA ligase/YqeY domain fusion protein [Trueperaceae bacterium]|nr:glutamine--tRNA ligase/YqeY domain fusion protein [Trueperaceae bacterium]
MDPDGDDVRRAPPPQHARIVAPNFITEAVDRDLEAGRVGEVITRFPPEPNGYLHIGHAKAIYLDFGVADDYGGRTILRFDDTNPTTEDPEYVASIQHDVAWLGFSWDELRHASDYFGRLYELACTLIRRGDAYVDSQSEAEIRETRGTITEPGRESPYRDRPAAESLDLFARMRDGAFEEGTHVLRAKIDMASPNMLMRDPLLYRIRHARHYRTGDAWHVYPMYDFAHPLSDAIEGVTHSLCTLEFENNREVYDWLVSRLFEAPRPHQYEFARLNLDHTVVSKRKLLPLVRGGYVRGWDDPRMPTLAGIRRRGVTPDAVRTFAARVGVTKANSRTDLGLLEATIRDDLNHRAPRALAVIDPVPLVLSDVPEGALRWSDASLWPHDVPREGTRRLPFGRTVWIERSDYADEPPKGWRRLSPGAAVRLRHGPVVICTEAERDADGQLQGLRGRTLADDGEVPPEGTRVNGVVNWVAADAARPAEFRLVDRLFADPDPGADGRDLTEVVNPASMPVSHGYVEPYVGEADPEMRWQFERQGYFWRDPVDGRGERLVFNRIVTLKDRWGRPARPAERASERTADDAGGEPVRHPPGDPGARPDPVEALDEHGRARFEALSARGLGRHDAARLAADADATALFHAACDADARPAPPSVANWLVNEVPRVQGDRPLRALALTPAALASLVAMVDAGEISSQVGKDLLAEVAEADGDPRAMVEQRGLRTLDDEDALQATIEDVLHAHPDEVASYRAGKSGLIGFFVGQAMKATGGRADPKAVRSLLQEALDR